MKLTETDCLYFITLKKNIEIKTHIYIDFYILKGNNYVFWHKTKQKY